MSAREGRVVLALGRRAFTVQFRRAQLLMPTLVLPLVLLAVIASGTSAGQELRGFPDVSSYLAFLVPGTIVQGMTLAGLSAGSRWRPTSSSGSSTACSPRPCTGPASCSGACAGSSGSPSSR